jgi:hypothetical protein
MPLPKTTRARNLIYFVAPPPTPHPPQINLRVCRSQWPRDRRYGCAAARLMGLQIRITPKAWVFVSCGCCLLSGRGLCVGLITRPGESVTKQLNIGLLPTLYHTQTLTFRRRNFLLSFSTSCI